MTLNSVSTSDAEADEGQQLLVIGEVRLDEAIDRGERAGGFLGGEDDEVLVILIVVELQLVVLVFVVVIIGGRRGSRLAAGDLADGSGLSRELLPSSGSSVAAGFGSSDEGGFGAMKPTDAARPA